MLNTFDFQSFNIRLNNVKYEYVVLAICEKNQELTIKNQQKIQKLSTYKRAAVPVELKESQS